MNARKVNGNWSFEVERIKESYSEVTLDNTGLDKTNRLAFINAIKIRKEPI